MQLWVLACWSSAFCVKWQQSLAKSKPSFHCKTCSHHKVWNTVYLLFWYNVILLLKEVVQYIWCLYCSPFTLLENFCSDVYLCWSKRIYAEASFFLPVTNVSYFSMLTVQLWGMACWISAAGVKWVQPLALKKSLHMAGRQLQISLKYSVL